MKTEKKNRYVDNFQKMTWKCSQKQISTRGNIPDLTSQFQTHTPLAHWFRKQPTWRILWSPKGRLQVHWGYTFFQIGWTGSPGVRPINGHLEWKKTRLNKMVEISSLQILYTILVVRGGVGKKKKMSLEMGEAVARNYSGPWIGNNNPPPHHHVSAPWREKLALKLQRCSVCKEPCLGLLLDDQIPAKKFPLLSVGFRRLHRASGPRRRTLWEQIGHVGGQGWVGGRKQPNGYDPRKAPVSSSVIISKGICHPPYAFAALFRKRCFSGLRCLTAAADSCFPESFPHE